jgi:hypothetical protein
MAILKGFPTDNMLHVGAPPGFISEPTARIETQIISEKGKNMKIVEFYRGERGNENGHTLADIMTWSNGALEMDHDYVQFMFPSNERSMMNCDAPTMTKEESQIFEADPELQERVKQSLVRFLDFLDFKLSRDDDEIVIEPKDENIPWFIRGPSRIGNIARCRDGRPGRGCQFAHLFANQL